MERSQIKKKAVIYVLLSFLSMMALFFLPAGTLHYWEAWVFMAVLFSAMMVVLFYLLRHDPELLARRLKLGQKEETPEFKGPWNLFLTILMALFILPGLDRRFGWSDIPPGIVLLGDGGVLAGYAFFFRTLKENSYASRVIEVAEGQKVIDTGPYRYVRHPMYTSIIIIYLAALLALGSWPAVVLMAVFLPFLMGYRIKIEEKVLLRDLPGYGAYMKKVKWRLVPYLW
jgi:protein-S-isoprenylcysteine O-methyltransferase Ste14